MFILHVVISMAKNGFHNISLHTTIILITLFGVIFSSYATTPPPGDGLTFSWNVQEISQISRDLATRRTETVLKIPYPGNPVSYRITSHAFLDITSDTLSGNRAYQPFKGRDTHGNPVYGYLYENRLHLSYYKDGQVHSIAPHADKKDTYKVISTIHDLGPMDCATLTIPGIEVRAGGHSIPCQVQNYRTWTFDLYIACTGEWGQYYGGDKAAARNAIINHVNALNAFYAGEMGIDFNLITEDHTIYTDPTTDPFNPASTVTNRADQARQFFKSRVSGSKYHLGHILHKRSGRGLNASGIAYLEAICKDDYKGGGWTGTSQPENVNFNLRVLGHEIGHQLGANHSFYGSRGNCRSPNRISGHGFEPGAGTSFMSYQGQCDEHNLDGAPSLKLYFNTHSVQEILTHLNSKVGCGTKSGSTSRVPVELPADFSVPLHTAFDLTAYANGSYNFNWEQYDSDYSSDHTDPLDGGKHKSAPMYRSYDPAPDGFHRSFPSSAAQEYGPYRGEVFATVERDITLRLMTRRPGVIQCDEMVVSVRNSPPFQILEPQENEVIDLSEQSVRARDKMTIRWETGETEIHGFPTVDIYYSINGGLTYPYILGKNVPNTGQYEVRPPYESSQARIKIQLSDGTGRMAIYHESEGDFTVAFSVLPLHIVSFLGKQEENAHLLSWTLNNSGEFVRQVQLEYSFDGIEYQGIPLAGYEVLNEEVEWSGSYRSPHIHRPQTFYRLVIEDDQAHKTYSPVVPFQNGIFTDDFWKLYPNPSDGEVRIDFASYLQPDATIKILSLEGQIVRQMKPSVQSRSVTVPLTCPDGLYIVEVVSGKEFYRKKLVVATGK